MNADERRYKTHGLTAEQAFCEKSLAILRKR